ncbi:unnamed protein product, partial [Polarella glacialis]
RSGRAWSWALCWPPWTPATRSSSSSSLCSRFGSGPGQCCSSSGSQRCSTHCACAILPGASVPVGTSCGPLGRQSSPGMPALLGALGANTGVFMLWQLERRRLGPRWLSRVMHGHALCSLAHLQHLRLHTLLTSSISHQRGVHFFVNSYGLLVFGGLAAEKLSTPELGCLLGACGVGASAAHVLAHSRSPVLGASGVLMGLLAADGLL